MCLFGKGEIAVGPAAVVLHTVHNTHTRRVSLHSSLVHNVPSHSLTSSVVYVLVAAHKTCHTHITESVVIVYDDVRVYTHNALSLDKS